MGVESQGERGGTRRRASTFESSLAAHSLQCGSLRPFFKEMAEQAQLAQILRAMFDIERKGHCTQHTHGRCVGLAKSAGSQGRTELVQLAAAIQSVKAAGELLADLDVRLPMVE